MHIHACWSFFVVIVRTRAWTSVITPARDSSDLELSTSSRISWWLGILSILMDNAQHFFPITAMYKAFFSEGSRRIVYQGATVPTGQMEEERVWYSIVVVFRRFRERLLFVLCVFVVSSPSSFKETKRLYVIFLFHICDVISNNE